MGKVFRPSRRETAILSRIESSKEHAKKNSINSVKEFIDPLSNAISMKLVENGLVETTNKNSLEEHIRKCLEKLSHAEMFDVDYQIAPFRNLVHQPHVVSLYVTAFIIEQLIKMKDIVDIFGSDEDIYFCVNSQIVKYIP